MLSDFLQPGLILIIFGLLILLIPPQLKKAAVIIGPAVTLCWIFFYEADKMSVMFGIIFGIISVIAAVYSLHVNDRFELAAEAVYAGSSISVVFAAHWVGMLIFWELMAVSSWLIVTASRTKEAGKAGFRYLMVHMLGGNLLLAGIVIKLSQGQTVIESLTGQADAAYWLILAGVAVNAAIPPFNAWISDAYPESTMGGTVYMGSFTTKVGVFCLIKLFAGTELLLYFGVFMAVWGACMALIENDFRRLFAYHIISQVGYMIASLAIGGEIGIDGASAHAFNHILYKGTLLMCAGTVIAATGKRKISQLSGLAKKLPVTAGCFLIASMAIAGFPLLNGFVSKSLIMNAAAESGFYWAELLLMIASVGTLMSVTLKVNYFVFWGKSTEDIEACEKDVPLSRKAAMILGALACIITGLFPDLIYSLTPYGTDGHPFTVDHVTQYIQLFAAATIAFVMYIEHMKPKEKITLDTDWFYRKPLKYTVLGLSKGIDYVRRKAGDSLGVFFERVNEYLHEPRLLITDKPPKSRDCLEDDDVLQKPVGWLIALSFILFAAIVVFILVKI